MIDALLDSELRSWMQAERRWFHANPELRFEERETAKRIAWYLGEWGLEVREGLADTGVVGILDRGPGPVLLLRADMDALPLREVGGRDYGSRNHGVMHACGHDAHMAMLLATIRLLSSEAGKKLQPRGTLVFVFQPGEEGGAGALRMLEEGLFEDFRPDMALALHVSPELPTGTVGVFPLNAMAAAQRVEFRLKGRGGHAAYPHRCIDPVPAAASLISALQTVVSRRIPPKEGAVVSICTMEGSDADNVIPNEVRLGGTIRFLDPSVGAQIKESIDDLVRGIGRAHGVDARWQVHMAYPPVVNDEGATAFVRQVAEDTVGCDRVRSISSEMVGEDFAYFLEKVPGCLWRLGTRGESEDSARPLHSDHFDLDEEAMAVGVKVWLSCVQRFFETGGGKRKR